MEKKPMNQSVAEGTDFFAELEEYATKQNLKWYKGKITSIGASPQGDYIVFVPTTGGTYGSIWPTWAVSTARDAFLTNKNIIVIADDGPTGDKLTHVAVVNY
jgi:hypothetical protein